MKYCWALVGNYLAGPRQQSSDNSSYVYSVEVRLLVLTMEGTSQSLMNRTQLDNIHEARDYYWSPDLDQAFPIFMKLLNAKLARVGDNVMKERKHLTLLALSTCSFCSWRLTNE